MRHRRIALPLALTAAFAALAGPAGSAPVPPRPFERTTLADGVSHLTVFAMHAGRDGFLWFGTMYGLVRYDGASFRTFRHDPFDSTSLPHDDVVTIAEDARGDLWLGTWGGGASYYDRRGGRFVRFLPGGADSTSISDGVVWAVVPRDDGTAWLGTGRGLDLVRDDGVVLRRWHESDRGSGFRALPVRALCRDHEGTLWVGTFGGGLAHLDEAGDGFLVDVPDSGSTAWHPGRQVTAILEDSAHRLWVGTYDRGLGVRSPGEEDFREVAPGAGWSAALASPVIQGLAEGPDGTVWVASQGGLDRVDPGSAEVLGFPPDIADPAALPAGNVTCVAVDASGGLWASAYQTGVVRMPARAPAFRTRLGDAEQPAGRNVVAFAETRDGTLWVATSAGLLAEPADGGAPRTFAPKRGTPGALPARPRTLAEDAHGTLWVGTFAGLRRFDSARARFALPFAGPSPADDAAVGVLLPARDGTLWVGAEGFLLRLAPDGDIRRFDPDPTDPGALPDGTVLSLAEDRRGRIWVGTYRGLARLDPGDSAFTRTGHDPRDPRSLASNYVYAIQEAPDGTLWFGTAGGLDRFDEATNAFAHFREREGLPNAVVGSVEVDADGRLWLGTQRGLARFDPATERAVAFGPSDGLQGHLFHPRASGRRRDGTLLFGGPGGFNAVHPTALPAPPAAPPVRLADLRIPGRALPAAFDASRLDQLRLSPHESFFTFALAAPDFDRGARVPLEYRLAGLEADWVRAGPERVAAYTSVPPGRYVFEARAAGGVDGPPGPALSVPVTVLPPFWRTPAFAAAALTLLLAAAGGAHRTALAVRMRHAEALARARQDERDAVRRAAAADFHDELGHRMARIGLFAELLARGGAPQAEVPSILDRIAREARRLADEARDFFWASGAERGTAAAVVDRLERFGGELFERSGVDFRVEGPDDGLDAVELPAEARRNMLSLFKEAMTNALRHASCREVVLHAGVDGETLTLRLQDDGRGFPAPAAQAGHGLRNMELRARRADGTLTIASAPGAGTRIALTRRVTRPDSGNAVEPAAAHPRGDRRG